MIWLRRIRYILWGAVGIASFFAIATILGWWSVDGPSGKTTRNTAPASIAKIGGPFAMTDQRGNAITDERLRGKPTMMFFGFTSCPEVCPTTLSEMSGWLEELGPAADEINAIFVSVDPERDTVDQMAGYLSQFDPRILGLTGTPAQLEQIASNYRFYYRRVSLDGGGYTMDHTAMVYLLDRHLRFAGTIDYHEDRQIALPKLRRLLGSAPAGSGIVQ